MALENDVHAIVSTILSRPNQAIGTRLHEALRMLCKWRAESLSVELFGQGELDVKGGPFEGMKYVATPSEGSLMPKIFGWYEKELHPVIEQLPGRGYAQVLNIGCAEGYYAVGLARMLDVTVLAHDVDERARALCGRLAELNGVAERVQVGGEVTHDDFATLDGKTFVLADIEGAERALLDPEKAPRLTEMDILVEVHESFQPGVGDELEERFSATHVVQRLASGDRSIELNRALFGRDNIEQLLSLWEYRLADPGWMWLATKT